MKDDDPATVELKPSMCAPSRNPIEFSGTYSECKDFLKKEDDSFGHSISCRYYIKPQIK